MKKNLMTLTMFLITIIVYSQNLTATTKDGRTVILKENKTWEFSDKKEDKRKITLEFTSKNIKKQFQVVYDAPDSKMVDSGNMIGGFYNSGWKKSIFSKGGKCLVKIFHCCSFRSRSVTLRDGSASDLIQLTAPY